MKLTIAVSNDEKIYNVDVSQDMSLLDFKAYIESETNVPVGLQKFSTDGVDILDDTRSLNSYNVKDGDLLLLSVISADNLTPSSSNQRVPGSRSGIATNNLIQNFIKSFNESRRKFYDSDAKIEELRNTILKNPKLKAMYPENEDMLTNQPVFRNWLKECIPDINNAFGSLKLNENDPKFLEDLLSFLKQRRIDENMRTAMEYSPETFGSITMLYVDMEINNHKFKAFVDSGAQNTIISPKLADKCGLSNLIDKRFKGMALGVGTSELLGKIHQSYIKLDGKFFPCSLSVLDTSVDFLLGLDMMKRHRGIIDLRSNKLILGDAEVSFLPEHECGSVANSMKADAAAGGFGGNIFSSENIGTIKRAKIEDKKIIQTTSLGHNNGAGSSTPSNGYSEASILQLMGLGFSREQVIRALDQSAGNDDIAASILFQ